MAMWAIAVCFSRGKGFPWFALEKIVEEGKPWMKVTVNEYETNADVLRMWHVDLGLYDDDASRS